MRSNLRKYFFIIVIQILISFSFIEIFARFYFDIKFDFTNFRTLQFFENDESLTPARFDKILGWAHKDSYFINDSFSTLENGRRLTNRNFTNINEIIAVGDSFTAGSEVGNFETWPHYLSVLEDTDVVNGGVGGYGTDQINLRAIDLLKLYPNASKIIISYLTPSDIQRTGFTHYGRPKPYFTKDFFGKYTLNLPTTFKSKKNIFVNKIYNLMGYSYFLHKFMISLRTYHYAAKPDHIFKEHGNIDTVDVTCHLLEKIKNEKPEIEKFLILQYGAGDIIANVKYEKDFPISECATKYGFNVIETFDLLRSIYDKSLLEFDSLFVITDKIHGHMSAKGNRLIAKHIADSLKNKTFYKDSLMNDYFSFDNDKYSILDTINTNELVNLVWRNSEALVTPKKKKGEIYIQSSTIPINSNQVSLFFDIKNNEQNNIKFQINSYKDDKYDSGIHLILNNNQIKGLNEISGVKAKRYSCLQDGCYLTVEFEKVLNSINIIVQILPKGNEIDVSDKAFAKIKKIDLLFNKDEKEVFK